MLILVLAANLPVMFIGWEGVGLCSFLLIGFWFENDDYATAGRKAFVVNRIGDFCFLLGMFLLFWAVKDTPSRASRAEPRLRRPHATAARPAYVPGRSWAAERLAAAAGICCSSARAASPRSCRCSCGCPTRWRARRRSRR